MQRLPDRLAVFDLDYTLTRRGTWGRFVALCMRGRAWRWPELAVRAGAAQALYKLGALPRIAVKTQMMRVAMTGRTRGELQALAEQFATAEVSQGFRPGGVAALRDQRDHGATVMVASAAVDLLVGPIARRLGVSDWVATEMAWSDSDRLLHHFGSPNCYGPEKLARVLRFYRGLKRSDTHITMYSDSAADVELLGFAHDAVAVNPSASLRTLARRNGWAVVDWNHRDS